MLIEALTNAITAIDAAREDTAFVERHTEELLWRLRALQWAIVNVKEELALAEAQEKALLTESPGQES